MQFANYNAFRVGVQVMLENDDTTGNTFSVNTLDMIIGLGEARVYNGDSGTAGLRASTMLADLSATVTGNAADLPADLLELKEVRFAGGSPLEIIQLDKLRTLEADAVGYGVTRYAAQDGDTLRFWPEASGTVIGRYYKRPEGLETVTWANATTFARYPELFLYSALYEGAIFLGMASMVPAWEAKYRNLADGANHSERMRVYGGSPLRMRAR